MQPINEQSDDGITNKFRLSENSCTLDDVELCFMNLHETYTLTEDGDIETTKELYMGEAYPAYFYCECCQTDWEINAVQSREQAWKLVKEHLNED